MAILVVSDMGGFGEAHGVFWNRQLNGGGMRLTDWAVGKGLLLGEYLFPE